MTEIRECVIRSRDGVCGRRLADTGSLVVVREARVRDDNPPYAWDNSRMANRPCVVDGCTLALNRAGRCRAHFAEAWRAGVVEALPCPTDGCDQPVATGNGYCEAHGRRVKLYGDTASRLRERASCHVCGKPAFSRQMCQMHYARWERTGTPIRLSLEETFHEHVVVGEAVNDCWGWTGPQHTNGYGLLRGAYAHRWSYNRFNGMLPAGKLVRHTCDNPPCTNPHHLVVGTHADNMNDMATRGRAAAQKLAAGQVLAVRAEHARGVSIRSLAKRHGVAPITMSRAISGKTWAWV